MFFAYALNFEVEFGLCNELFKLVFFFLLFVPQRRSLQHNHRQGIEFCLEVNSTKMILIGFLPHKERYT